jgi:hypothetical protein
LIIFHMNLDDLILQAVTSAEMPLKAAQVVKLVKPQAGRAATPKVVTTALDALAAAGRLNRLPAGKTALFTTLGLEQAAEAMLRPLIHAAKQPPQAAKLRAKLPVVLQPHFEVALGALVAQGAAFVMPGAKRLVHSRRPKPSELLDTAKRRALQNMLDDINALRGTPLTLADFAAWLDDEERAEPSPLEIETPKTAPLPEDALLREWYEQDRLRSSTMMIAIPRTFERYAAWAAEKGGAADSQVLRNLMTELYNNGRILLEPCERPQDLPEHERAMLVPMSLGPPGYSWCWIA